MMRWYLKHPKMTPDMLGAIPLFLLESDPRPAAEQFDERYSHGGGFRPMPNFTLTEAALHYPDDPPFRLLAEAKLRDETIRFYEGSWVAIIQPDGSYQVSRMD